MGLIDRVVKEEIKKLERIKDTFDDRFDYLRLDKNERIIPFKEDHLNDLRRRIKSEDISGYAELGPIYRKLADYLGVKADQLLLATGSDLAIKSIYEACVSKGDSVVLHMPSYAMCRVYAGMFGAAIKAVPVKNDWSVDVDAMLAAVDPTTKMLAIENPNGFVGTKPELSQIEYCAAWLKKKEVLLLIDEAYYYVENSKSEAVDLILKYPNLIVSQTFSKCHGIAGTRFGYLVGDPLLMKHISKVRPTHEVTSLTVQAAGWILDHPEILEDYRKQIKESKAFLMSELGRLGIKYRDAHGNFMLIYCPDEGKTKGLTEKLKKKKILVRRPFEEPYLFGWIRITMGSIEDSKILAEALKTIL